MKGAKQRTVNNGMLSFLPTVLPAAGTTALLLQVFVNLMMDNRLLDAVQAPFGFG